MRRLSILSLLCFAVLLAASSSAQADSADDPPLISIDVENGASTMDTITFTGVLEDEVEPSEFFWRVAKNGSTFDGGDLKSSFDEIHSTPERDDQLLTLGDTLQKILLLLV